MVAKSPHRHRHYTRMNNLPSLLGSSAPFPVDRPTSLAAKCWLDDACIIDIDHFVKTLSGIKAKGVRPDLIGSIITHYACKWIPELSTVDPSSPSPTTDHQETPTVASWLKKRFFIETIVSVLPPEKDAVPCSFSLRLLKTSNMVGVDSSYREEVEKRVAWRLDQATLQELMIPSFSHVKDTLLDVELMLRLVKRFVEMDIEGLRGAAGMFKVAKLVDAYLAEAAVDSELTLPEFMELAAAVPAHARATHDGLYRAIDIYLKAHDVKVTKQERKMLCKLIDSQKLSIEASLHAAQNDRLPVRSVIQLLFSDQQTKLIINSRIDSVSSSKSPLQQDPRGHSSRDHIQQMEIKKLKEKMAKLERQCHLMQLQIGKLSESKKRRFFSWRRLAAAAATPVATGHIWAMTTTSMETVDDDDQHGYGYDSCSVGKQTPLKHGRSSCKIINTHKTWRQSSS